MKLGVSLVGEDDDAGRKQLHDHPDFGGPVHDRTGIAMECTNPRLQVCTVFNKRQALHVDT